MRVGTLVGGRYRLVRGPLRGGMGEVWQAEDEQLGRAVVLKRVLTSEAGRDRFDRLRAEGRALARFSHPHVVTLYDVQEIGGGRRATSWLVMEYVSGGSLESRPGLAPERVARIGVQLADALAALHAEGIVHGDVKPGNVVVTPEGLAKLADFGAAYRVGGQDTITQNGAVSYTPDFAAPEMVAGRPERASDVFSLGALLYCLVTGAPPRPGGGLAVDPYLAEQRAARGETALDADTGVLADVLPALLARDPEQRPGAKEVRALLEPLAGVQEPVPGAGTRGGAGPQDDAVPADGQRELRHGAHEDDRTHTAPPRRPGAQGGAHPSGVRGGARGGGPAGEARGGARRHGGWWGRVPGPARSRPALSSTTAVLVLVLVLLATPLREQFTGIFDGEDGNKPGGAAPLIGDHRTADPCALTDPAALARFGETRRDRDYGNFDRCDVLVETGDGEPVDVEVNLDHGGRSELAAPQRTVGRIAVVAQPAESDACGRTLLPPTGHESDREVSVTVQAKQDEGGAPLCAMADAATDSALKALRRGTLPRRSPPLPEVSLARHDACTLLSARALEVVPGIDAGDPDVGYGNWDCEWSSTTNGLWIELRFDRGPEPTAEDGTPTRIGGKYAVVEPEAEGEDTCRVRVVHRSYRDDQGDTAVETLNLTVGGDRDAEQLRRMATELAGAAVARTGAG